MEALIVPIATIIALFGGPAFAVWFGDRLQKRAFIRSQRVNLFDTLMATRSTAMAPDRLRALGLIEVVFHGEQRVLDRWRNYYDSMNNPAFNDQNGGFIRLANYHDMLTAMARVLGYGNIGAGELSRSYYPQLQVALEQAQQQATAEWLRVLQNSENLGTPRQGGSGTSNVVPIQPPPASGSSTAP